MAWADRALGDPMDTAYFSLIADRADAGRVSLYVGAGLSRGDPTGMPDSRQLTRSVTPQITTRLGHFWPGAAADPSLEDMADAAQTAGTTMLRAVKSILAAIPELSNRPPNYGHVAVAALLREGLVTVLSVNWDRAIESGATKLNFRLPVNRTAADRATGWTRKFSKIHGCVTDPDSLCVTTTEIMSPAAWALTEVDYALLGGQVIFIGLGTIPDLLQTKITAQLAVSPDSITVVTPAISPLWTAMLGPNSPVHRNVGADEFLDDVCRAVCLRMLAEATRAVGHLRTANASFAPWVTALQQVIDAFHVHTALSLMTWLRAGGGGVEPGMPFLADSAGADVIVALAGLAAIAPVRVTRRGATLAVLAGASYIEPSRWPGTPSNAMMTMEVDRTDELRLAGVYDDLSAPIAHLSSGYLGPLPDPLLVSDLVSTPSATSVLTGPKSARHVWVPVEGYLQGQFGV